MKTNEEKIAAIDSKIESFRQSLEEAVNDLKTTRLKFTDELGRSIQMTNDKFDYMKREVKEVKDK